MSMLIRRIDRLNSWHSRRQCESHAADYLKLEAKIVELKAELEASQSRVTEQRRGVG